MTFNTKALLSLALVATFVMVGGDAFAAATGGAGGAGAGLLDSIEKAITGNIGLIIGLCLAVLGIWTWVVKQETAAGIMLIVGGILITITPGVFNSVRSFIDPFVKSVGTTNTQVLPTI